MLTSVVHVDDGLGHPHDHTAPAMQIHTDKLKPCVL